MKYVTLKRSIVSFVFSFGVLFAHDHWIDTNQFHAKTGQEITIWICSGHYYSESNFAVKDKLIFETNVLSSSGSTFDFQTLSKKKRREGKIQLSDPGVYLVQAILKRPQLNEPEYWLRSIVVVDSGEISELKYKTGQGLEIIPLENISELKTGDKLTLQTQYNGESVRGMITVSIAGQKNFLIHGNKQGLANLSIKQGGKYLMTFSYGGKGCSLTFELNLEGND